MAESTEQKEQTEPVFFGPPEPVFFGPPEPPTPPEPTKPAAPIPTPIRTLTRRPVFFGPPEPLCPKVPSLLGQVAEWVAPFLKGPDRESLRTVSIDCCLQEAQVPDEAPRRRLITQLPFPSHWRQVWVYPTSLADWERLTLHGVTHLDLSRPSWELRGIWKSLPHDRRFRLPESLTHLRFPFRFVKYFQKVQLPHLEYVQMVNVPPSVVSSGVMVLTSKPDQTVLQQLHRLGQIQTEATQRGRDLGQRFRWLQETLAEIFPNVEIPNVRVTIDLSGII